MVGADSQAETLRQARQLRCRACGALLWTEAVPGGLCPACLLQLALGPVDDEAPPRESAADPSPSAAVSSQAGLRAGQVLGNRYEMRTRVGSGAMGEVWRAFDLKLRLDVALKAVRPELLARTRAGAVAPGGAVGPRRRLAQRLPGPRPLVGRGSRDAVDGIRRWHYGRANPRRAGALRAVTGERDRGAVPGRARIDPSGGIRTSGPET